MHTEQGVLAEMIQAELIKVQRASRKIPRLEAETIAVILNQVADEAIRQSDYLLEENKKDLDRMDPADSKYDRLMLTEARLEGIAADLRNVADLHAPLGYVLEERTLPNNLQLQKISVPIGVIGIVYESRPNVTFDVFALCLKSGNASVLKGSRDAHFSNIAIVRLIKETLEEYDLSDSVFLAPSQREALGPILQADDYIDLIIPRGGKGLINFVRQNALVPVIETGAGIVHTYYDQSADFEKGKRIIENAKTRRVSVCNALDTLIIHQDRLGDLPRLLGDMGRSHQVIVYADEQAHRVLVEHYPNELLFEAEPAHFGTEFLSLKMSVKVVADIDGALDHIADFSSRHSEAIVAEDAIAIETFLKNVDAAVVYANASTAFTDGAQFGLGAEIGISTQKLHARGPMALRELCSYKWLVRGEGEVRGKS